MPRKPRTRKARPYSRALARPIAGPKGAFIAPRVTTTHKYAESLLITATSGVMSDYQFRLNSVYDPDFAFGGHQPMGSDQMRTLYNRYRVDGVKVRVHFHKSTETGCAAVAIVANNSVAPFTDPFSAIQEQGLGKYATLSYSTAGSQTHKLLRDNYSLHKVTGVTKTKYESDDLYQATEGANPTEAIQLHVIITGLATNTNTQSALMTIELDYLTTWYDPIVVGQS